jgi:hypothetical protein
MTGRLNLRLDKYLMSDSVERAAVASIRSIPTTDAGAPSRRLGDVVIPSGASAPVGIDLAAGRYLVEATLPSGDVVADEVDVFDDAVADLHLRPDESPHEWLSWQQFLGLIDRREVYYSGWNEARPLATTARWVREPMPQLRGDQPRSGDTWAFLADLSAHNVDVVSSVSQGPSERINAFQSDSQSYLYQTTRAGPWDSFQLPTTYEGGAPYTPRHYLVVDADGFTQLVCVPTPWIDVRRGTEIPAQVLVRRGNGGAVAISVTMRDPLYGPALGYMTHGALATAKRLFDDAKEMLFDKLTNPLAAAGGGYVLLATERDLEQKPWHGWIANLMNWFEWLPDGAIQLAWLRLRHRTEPRHLDEAREALFTAYDRGLPFFSVGLQWLIDGLTLFAPQDTDAQRMLRNVHRVASGVDATEPFTILRLPLR